MKLSVANRLITCYAQHRKQKSLDICTAFAAGCGGIVGNVEEKELRPGDCAFYGVRPAWDRLWKQAKAEQRNWYYIDNAYFDCAREKYFRVVRNGLQCDGQNAVWGEQGEKRLASLGIKIKEWRKTGKHVVVCPQSAEFLSVVAGFQGNWEKSAVE